jgi:predicted Zn-dependent peptidase
VLAGALPADVVLQKASRIWGVWVRADETPFAFLPPQKPAGRVIHLDDEAASPAAQMIAGNLWPSREDRDYYAATLAARILQERLTKSLPTSLVTVASAGRRMSGPFYIQAQAAAEQAVSEFKKISDVVDAFKESGATAEELSQAKKRWIDEFNSSFRTTDGICRSILTAELYRLGTNYAVSVPEFVLRTDAEALTLAARDWIFPGGLLLYIRGPASILKPALDSLGTVHPAAP